MLAARSAQQHRDSADFPMDREQGCGIGGGA